MTAQRASGCLMVQGTTSNAGKSTIVTALCRIFANAGISIAPFKPQNMALNSAVSSDGGEIARAQAVQALACRIPSTTDMNPLLLKPNSHQGSQVILNGRALGNFRAEQYRAMKPQLLNDVVSAFQRLQAQHDVVIVEGAGSPAEINLRENDIANMGFAEAVDCPVILVVDIDRGGAFAHVVGTLELLTPSERKKVVGVIINRFRGDPGLLTSGLEWLEKKTGIPVLAVIPYIEKLHLDAEDMPAQALLSRQANKAQKVSVRVPAYPRMSNHTDFDALSLHPQVDFAFVKEAHAGQETDLIILPGSKTVATDYHWLEQNGWPQAIKRHLRYGGKLLGICGGFQMLGEFIHDPDGIETAESETRVLGLLAMRTTLLPQKTLRNAEGWFHGKDIPLTGYEIHAGISEGPALEKPLISLSHRVDGVISDDGQIWGTYIHGLLDGAEALNHLLSWVREDYYDSFDRAHFQEAEIQRLAQVVECSLPLQKLIPLLN